MTLTFEERLGLAESLIESIAARIERRYKEAPPTVQEALLSGRADDILLRSIHAFAQRAMLEDGAIKAEAEVYFVTTGADPKPYARRRDAQAEAARLRRNAEEARIEAQQRRAQADQDEREADQMLIRADALLAGVDRVRAIKTPSGLIVDGATYDVLERGNDSVRVKLHPEQRKTMPTGHAFDSVWLRRPGDEWEDLP